MTEWDNAYIDLCNEIRTRGIEVENRTGINTIKVPAHELEFDLQNEFPILTTKQVFFKKAVIEMLWIWQMGSNKVQDLHDRNVKIWDEWVVDKDGIYRIYEPKKEGFIADPNKEVPVLDPLSVPIDDPFGKAHKMQPKLDSKGNVKMAKSLKPGETIREAKWYGKKYAGTIGTAYGFITDRYKFAQNLIDTIKNDPKDRRMVKSLWQDEFLRTAVLPSCVWSTEWDITNGKLHLLVHQRSCDVPLGLPFNVSQYATLLSLIAHCTGLEPGIIRYSIKDAHIYVNQIDGIEKQIKRAQRYHEMLSMSPRELLAIRENCVQKMMNLDEKSEAYKLLDTEVRTVNMVLNPGKPELWINPEITDFFAFDNSKDLNDIKILNYKHMGEIKMPIAQ